MQLRGGARWDFYEDFYIKGLGQTLFTDFPDPLYKVRGALGQKNLEAGYTHWVSASGEETDGFYGQLQGNVMFDGRHLGELSAGFDYARGTNGDERLGPNESQSVYFGFTFEPIKELSLSATAEQIRDLDSEKEWRGTFALAYRFTGWRPEAHP